MLSRYVMDYVSDSSCKEQAEALKVEREQPQCRGSACPAGIKKVCAYQMYHISIAIDKNKMLSMWSLPSAMK